MTDTARKSDLIDLAMIVHVRTERAVFVSDDGDRERAVWLPLSQIEIEMQPDGSAIVTLPERLAIEKELV